MKAPDFPSWSRDNLNNYARDAWQQHQAAQEMPTLLDMFAMFALNGAMTRESFADGLTFTEKAEWVYAMSNAMMQERKKI